MFGHIHDDSTLVLRDFYYEEGVSFQCSSRLML